MKTIYVKRSIEIEIQGDSGGLGLGYVDINSVSFGGYPEPELSQHNSVRDHQNHPVDAFSLPCLFNVMANGLDQGHI